MIMSEQSFVAEVKKKWQIAENTFAFELIGAEGTVLPKFEAGAHIDIVAGQNLTRQYSIANDPAEDNKYVLGILKTANPGGVSTAVCTRLEEGGLIRLAGPRNHFPLNEEAPFSLLIGGGIGITPMLAMAHRLHAINKPFALHFFARNASTAPFYEDIKDLPFFDKINIYLDESNGNPQLSLQKILLGAETGSHVYTCGPSGFMNLVIDMSKQVMPEDRIHKEFFEFVEKETVNTAFEIEINSTGQVITIPENRAAIDVLQENGVFVPRNCPKGVCGACARQVIAGEIDHRDSVLPQMARDQGYMLLCVSRAKSERIVLDL
jgi:vanillate monooxygenase ferredoxin subunit